MNENTIKTALVVALTIAAVLYVNKNYLHLEQRLALP